MSCVLGLNARSLEILIDIASSMLALTSTMGKRASQQSESTARREKAKILAVIPLAHFGWLGWLGFFLAPLKPWQDLGFSFGNTGGDLYYTRIGGNYFAESTQKLSLRV
ncbi:hypothetical protein PABG_02535 [Paracoccidioides brasiliensis Pb03]|nr:hypothetical protein PABG_02535 [Paracoccidioides brasiliensis Pb03]